MAQVVVAQRMWQRRDTAANWQSKNPVLAAGEWGVEFAPVGQTQKAKLGDGASPWNDLPYFVGGAGILELVPGTNINIDNADPQRPVVNASFPPVPPVSGGVVPMVNGEVVNGQPVFMYRPEDGQLIYAEV